MRLVGPVLMRAAFSSSPPRLSLLPRLGICAKTCNRGSYPDRQANLAQVLVRICTPESLAKDPLLKAVGRGRTGLRVVDATAGFGHDSLRMAAAGAPLNPKP